MKLEVRDLTKRYGKKLILNHVSFTFEEGKIYGLIGRNGVGKTTFFNCINQDVEIDSGSFNIIDNELEKKLETSNIGYVQSNPIVPEFLTGKEFLQFFIEINKDRVDTILNNINDSDKLDPLGMEEFLPSNIEGEIESNNSKNVENNSYRPLDTRIEKKKKTKQTYLNSKIDDGIIVDENGEELIEGPNGHKKSGNGTEIEKGNGGQAILGTAGEGHRSEKEKIKISNIKTPYMNEPGKYIISFVPEVTSPNCELKVRLAGEDVFENIKIKKMYLLDEHGKSEINTFDVIEQKKITLEVYFDDINRAALEVNCYAKK